MKKKIIILLMMFILFTSIGLAATLPSPSPNFYVYDEAKVLESDTVNYIINLNKEMEAKTGSQVVVAVVNSLDGMEIEDYAVRLFRKWGIGDKQKNNGVLLLVSLEDRKVRIEVGYGLEGALSDSKAGNILDDYMIPYFEENKYDIGIRRGFTAVNSVIQDEYGIELETLDSELSEILTLIIVIFIVVLVTAIVIYFWGGSSSGGRSGFSSGSSFSSFDSFGGGGSGGGGFSGGGGASGGW